MQANPGNGSQKIIWTGKQRELADFLKRSFKEGKLKAPSEYDVLQQMVEHFQGTNGKSWTAKSIHTNLRNRDVEKS